MYVTHSATQKKGDACRSNKESTHISNNGLEGSSVTNSKWTQKNFN